MIYIMLLRCLILQTLNRYLVIDMYVFTIITIQGVKDVEKQITNLKAR